MKYKALALDLDGTLTDREKKVPAGNKEAIAKAIDAGYSCIRKTAFWNNTNSQRA